MLRHILFTAQHWMMKEHASEAKHITNCLWEIMIKKIPSIQQKQWIFQKMLKKKEDIFSHYVLNQRLTSPYKHFATNIINKTEILLWSFYFQKCYCPSLQQQLDLKLVGISVRVRGCWELLLSLPVIKIGWTNINSTIS